MKKVLKAVSNEILRQRRDAEIKEEAQMVDMPWAIDFLTHRVVLEFTGSDVDPKLEGLALYEQGARYPHYAWGALKRLERKG